MHVSGVISQTIALELGRARTTVFQCVCRCGGLLDHTLSLSLSMIALDELEILVESATSFEVAVWMMKKELLISREGEAEIDRKEREERLQTLLYVQNGQIRYDTK